MKGGSGVWGGPPTLTPSCPPSPILPQTSSPPPDALDQPPPLLSQLSTVASAELSFERKKAKLPEAAERLGARHQQSTLPHQQPQP